MILWIVPRVDRGKCGIHSAKQRGEQELFGERMRLCGWGGEKEGRVSAVEGVVRLFRLCGGSAVEGVFEDLAGFESEDAASGDLDLLAGLGISTDAGFFLTHDEVAKARDFEFVAVFKGFFDSVEHEVHKFSRIFFGEADGLVYFFDEIGFGHRLFFHGLFFSFWLTLEVKGRTQPKRCVSQGVCVRVQPSW